MPQAGPTFASDATLIGKTPRKKRLTVVPFEKTNPLGLWMNCVVESQTGFSHDGGKSSVQWDKRW